jgi:translation initiation factor IF-2
MEELRQRLVAETTLTPEQVAIAIKVISPYQQEELLQLPSSELEAKTRALAAIPSARPLSLRRQGAPLGAPAAAPPQAAPATPPPAPSIGLKRPNSSATASGLVAPQGPTLVPPASKLVAPQLLAPAAALVAPQGSQLLAPAAPLVAPQEAAPVAADVPPEPPPAPEEAKKSYSWP